MCGFISIFGSDGTPVLTDVLDGLLAIQHRGQDAAGVVTYDGQRFNAKKGIGLVREVFETKHLDRLKGNMALGHVRYPTVGKGESMDVQPFWHDFPFGIAMAHNGNVTNFVDLKTNYFPRHGIPLSSDCDLEAVLDVMAKSLVDKGNLQAMSKESIFEAIGEVFKMVKGAYSVVGMIAGKGMFAFRDPYGIKPIIFGERQEENGSSYALASESVVLDVTGYSNKRDLQAGEALWIDMDRNLHWKKLTDSPHRPCIFEQVYFARPDSILDDISVYKTRMRMGEAIAKKFRKTGLKPDVVIPVPESARTAAQAMAQELGVPCREGLVKSRYVGRTFIMADNDLRKKSIRQKLNPIPLEFKDKKVLLLDDSIVRGNTSRELVRMAKEAGAKEVYLASYSPPLIYQCPYGIDMSTKKEFIARDRTDEELRVEIGCDALIYQDLPDMVEAARVGNPCIEKFCTACFDGDYPTGDITSDILDKIEDERVEAHT
jgi:amidophosphoribosyltransferase